MSIAHSDWGCASRKGNGRTLKSLGLRILNTVPSPGHFLLSFPENDLQNDSQVLRCCLCLLSMSFPIIHSVIIGNKRSVPYVWTFNEFWVKKVISPVGLAQVQFGLVFQILPELTGWAIFSSLLLVNWP